MKNISKITAFFCLFIFSVMAVAGPALANQDISLLRKKVSDLKAHYANISEKSSTIDTDTKGHTVNRLRARKAINMIRAEITRLQALIKELEALEKEASSSNDNQDVKANSDNTDVNQNALDMMDIDDTADDTTAVTSGDKTDNTETVTDTDASDKADDTANTADSAVSDGKSDSTDGNTDTADNKDDADSKTDNASNDQTGSTLTETLSEFEVYTAEGAILKVNEYCQADAEEKAGFSAGTLNSLTALSMLLDFHKIDNSIVEMAAAIKDSETGVDIDGLVEAAKNQGYDNARYEKGKDLEFVETAVRTSKPFIALVTDQDTGQDYYVAVIGITKDNVIVNDPRTGKRVEWPRTEFMKAWGDESCIAVILEKSSETANASVSTDTDTAPDSADNSDTAVFSDNSDSDKPDSTLQTDSVNTSDKTSKRVLCLGDSITANGGYIKRLEELTGGKIEFVKAATVGHRTDQMLKRITEPGTEGYVNPAKFDTIIVMGGVNNIWAGEKKIESDLEKIFSSAKSRLKAPAKVIMLKILPFKGYSTWKSSYHNTILSVNSYFDKNKGKILDHVVDTFKVLSDPSDSQRLFPDFTSDKLHPNSRGQKKMGEYIYSQIFE